mmetsp:Transcript_17365/g.56818  ORF Transcript_17365/g.56818 Transcript_17365/m.56818 type:complete len:281 (-) Transcript_17365:1921-2763(-)|eukprot:scaffold11423_cov123-Isochrysis_galbana.AAC.6
MRGLVVRRDLSADVGGQLALLDEQVRHFGPHASQDVVLRRARLHQLAQRRLPLAATSVDPGEEPERQDLLHGLAEVTVGGHQLRQEARQFDLGLVVLLQQHVQLCKLVPQPRLRRVLLHGGRVVLDGLDKLVRCDQNFANARGEGRIARAFGQGLLEGGDGVLRLRDVHVRLPQHDKRGCGRVGARKVAVALRVLVPVAAVVEVQAGQLFAGGMVMRAVIGDARQHLQRLLHVPALELQLRTCDHDAALLRPARKLDDGLLDQLLGLLALVELQPDLGQL